MSELGLEERIVRLQKDFDDSFAKGVEEVPSDLTLHLMVRVGDEHLALPITHINRLVRDVNVVPLPGAPAHLKGVMNLRGDLVAVYDLPYLMGYRSGREFGGDVVVTKGLSFDAGIAVSEIGTLVSLNAGEAGAVPATVPSALQSMIRGTTYLDEQLLMYLDLGQLVSKLDARV
jgi:purine-binding chemotaxis protein CheW